MRAHGLDVNGMQAGQPLLHVVQFLLVLPLPLVDLLLQQLYLVVEFLSLPAVVLEVDLELLLQVFNLRVLDLDELAQSLQFRVEFLVLVAHVLPEVADLIVEDLLEFIPDEVDLFVLLLHHVHEILPVLLDDLLQPADFVVLLLLDALVLLVDGGVGVGLFLDLLAHPGQLKLVLLLCLVEGSSHLGQLLLYPIVRSILFLSCD